MAHRRDITIDQGANYRMTIDYRNPDGTGIDLSGYTFSFYVKDRPGGTTYMNGSTYVTRDTTNPGRILVNVPASVTAGLNFDQGVYDIVITNGADRTRVIQGRALLSRAVST